MVALNVVLIVVIVVAVAARSRGRSSAIAAASARPRKPDAPLHENLTMPRDLRTRRMVRSSSRRESYVAPADGLSRANRGTIACR